MSRDYSYLIGNQFAKGRLPNKTSFKKGIIPWNKNLKGIHLSPQSEFKKGCKPPRRYKLGTITERKSKGGTKRNFVKIKEPNTWCELAKHLWIQAYGQLKKGDIVHHMNGNILDDRISNLIALPRKDHPKFHGRCGLRLLTERQISYYKNRYSE